MKSSTCVRIVGSFLKKLFCLVSPEMYMIFTFLGGMKMQQVGNTYVVAVLALRRKDKFA